MKKWYQISLFVIACIFINLAGKTFADYCSLPLWLDSFGTVLVAYALGPVCGSIVGVTMNILYSASDPVSYIYSLTSIAIGVIVGLLARRKWFDTLFGTISASVLVTFFAVAVSASMSFVRAGGMTGNVWGDGVIEFFYEQKVPFVLSAILGQFYIDFVDKVITLFFLYLAIKLWRARKPLRIKLMRFARKHKHLPCITVLFAAGFCALAPAKGAAADVSAYVQTVFSSANGLPCGEANDVVQTNDGILWIGTYAGLYRYNGIDFRWMNEYSSVRNVTCLYLDEEGRLWIGTNDNGVSITINERIVNVIDIKSGLPSNSVRCITKSSDGYYYVGTSSGMVVMTLDSGLRVLNTIPNVHYATSIDSGQNGNIAATTANGALNLIRDRILIETALLPTGTEMFTTCMFGADGLLYAGTSQNRILIYDISSRKFVRVGEKRCGSLSFINRLYTTKDGQLFVCSDNGIGYFAGDTFKIINTGAFNNSIDNMMMDYQGNLWFASSRQGLLRLSNSAFTNMYGSLGMNSRVVNTITEWQGALYIGTDSGLDIIEKTTSRPLQNALSRRLNGVRIRCIKTDSAGNLWVCTYGKGLLCVAPNGAVTSYDNANGMFGDWVRVVLELSDKTMLAAGDTGISYLQNGKVVHSLKYGAGLNNAMILTLMELSDGTVLAGSDGDGIAVIKDGKVVRYLTTDDGLTSGVILRTVAASNGYGTFIVTSNSLCYMNSSGEIRPLNHFPYFNNYDIWTTPGGRLFVLGSAGIYVVNENDVVLDKDVIPYDLLDAKSGLNSALTANSWDYCDADGNLYLASGTGVYMVNIQNYNTGRHSYRMKMSQIALDSVVYPVERGMPFVIDRNVNKIDLYPEVINYTALDPYVSYWLEGFDTKKTIVLQSDLTNVTYTNLPAGTYVFHLAMLDNKSDTVMEQSNYVLVKERSIHDNGYFRAYMILVALVAVAWLTWVVVRTQLQRTLNAQRKEVEFAREQVRMANETILTIAKTVDAKDENTSQHSTRVSDYSVLIAREMGMSEEECENLRRAALLHDIGKIGIPDRILNKPARLDDDEYAVMKSHVTRGAEILKNFTLIQHVSEGVLYHHEKYDGTGYPQHLQGENIPLYGRIIGVADAFDAMTANRVYRKKLDINYVINELKRCRGTQFDPRIADIMLKLIENGTIDIEKLYKGDRAD